MTDKGQFYNDDNKKGNDYNGFGRLFFYSRRNETRDINALESGFHTFI